MNIHFQDSYKEKRSRQEIKKPTVLEWNKAETKAQRGRYYETNTLYFPHQRPSIRVVQMVREHVSV